MEYDLREPVSRLVLTDVPYTWGEASYGFEVVVDDQNRAFRHYRLMHDTLRVSNIERLGSPVRIEAVRVSEGEFRGTIRSGLDYKPVDAPPFRETAVVLTRCPCGGVE